METSVLILLCILLCLLLFIIISIFFIVYNSKTSAKVISNNSDVSEEDSDVSEKDSDVIEEDNNNEVIEEENDVISDNNIVKVYDSDNYDRILGEFKEGKFSFKDTLVDNDVASLQIKNGYLAVLYDDYDYNNTIGVYKDNTPTLGAFKNKLSSIHILKKT